jgi:hypothetical protein
MTTRLTKQMCSPLRFLFFILSSSSISSCRRDQILDYEQCPSSARTLRYKNARNGSVDCANLYEYRYNLHGGAGRGRSFVPLFPLPPLHLLAGQGFRFIVSSTISDSISLPFPTSCHTVETVYKQGILGFPTAIFNSVELCISIRNCDSQTQVYRQFLL